MQFDVIHVENGSTDGVDIITGLLAASTRQMNTQTDIVGMVDIAKLL